MTTSTMMQGKLVMVTGATDGIGKETARALAQMGAQVIVVGRNPAKIEATIDEIQAQSGNRQIDGLRADFAALDEVRALAAAFMQRYDRLDVLVNNAGGFFNTYKETADGFEQSFGINHLAPFLLTHLLLDALKTGAHRSGSARIVNVSSAAHMLGKMNFDDLQGRKRFSGMRAYAQSKLANLLFTYELARRMRGRGITSNALHPGAVASNFARNQPGWGAAFFKLALRFGLTPVQGAQTSIYLASSPKMEGITGNYYVKCKAVRSSPASYDTAAAARLWQISEDLAGVESSSTATATSAAHV
ncbi:MAG TPA: SDR family oxidoreductase [Herpetosiphonaceae bacterium]